MSLEQYKNFLASSAFTTVVSCSNGCQVGSLQYVQPPPPGRPFGACRMQGTTYTNAVLPANGDPEGTIYVFVAYNVDGFGVNLRTNMTINPGCGIYDGNTDPIYPGVPLVNAAHDDA